MRRSRCVHLMFAAVAAGSAAACAQPFAPPTVSYEGQLSRNGAAYSDLTDLRFALFDSSTGGTQIGAAVFVSVAPDPSGRFVTDLPFDATHFSDPSRYLEISVLRPDGQYEVLTPRQRCTSAGRAKRAATATTTDHAATAAHATLASVATSATTAAFASAADHAQLASQVDLAATAALANSVPYSGVSGLPWTMPNGMLRTDFNLGIGKLPIERVETVGIVRINNQNINLRLGSDINHLLGWYGGTKDFGGALPDGPVLAGFAGGMLAAGNQPIIRWTSSGQVGINASSPFSNTLDVNGSAAKPGGGAWSVLSDPRTKDQVRPLTGTLDRLLQLRGYQYEYLPQYVESGAALPGTQIGLLASEVLRVFPDWVATGHDDGLMRVTERSTTALLVEALRELAAEDQREIDALTARISELEAASRSP